MILLGHLVHGHVAVAPGAAPSKAPARRPKCDARVVLSKARLRRVGSRPAWGLLVRGLRLLQHTLPPHCCRSARARSSRSATMGTTRQRVAEASAVRHARSSGGRPRQSSTCVEGKGPQPWCSGEIHSVPDQAQGGLQPHGPRWPAITGLVSTSSSALRLPEST